MEEKAKIIISVSEGKFEISGSEKFVSAQIENFKDLIASSVNQPKTFQPKATAVPETEIKPENQPSSIQSNDILDDSIYVEDENLIKIICDIPGNNNTEKTQNIALLYAYARKKQGQEPTVVEEIKTVCLDHSCLDKPNFSKTINKGDPKLYIGKGKGKERTIKLTRQGMSRAEEIIELIRQNGK